MHNHTFRKEASDAGFVEDIHGNYCYREFQVKPSHSYYFILTGFVPLELAHKLYSTPIGKNEIRVSGHCGCPPPEAPWVDWYTDKGVKVVPMSELHKFQELMPQEIPNFHFDDIPSRHNGFVTTYHIDSVFGLAEFIRVAREYYLTKETVTV